MGQKGVAPERITASLVKDGRTVETRPLCTYPKVARWTGTGSTNEEANFVCKEETNNNQLNAENSILPDAGGVQQE